MVCDRPGGTDPRRSSSPPAPRRQLLLAVDRERPAAGRQDGWCRAKGARRATTKQGDRAAIIGPRGCPKATHGSVIWSGPPMITSDGLPPLACRGSAHGELVRGLLVRRGNAGETARLHQGMAPRAHWSQDRCGTVDRYPSVRVPGRVQPIVVCRHLEVEHPCAAVVSRRYEVHSVERQSEKALMVLPQRLGAASQPGVRRRVKRRLFDRRTAVAWYVKHQVATPRYRARLSDRSAGGQTLAEKPDRAVLRLSQARKSYST